jgi:putative membrane protein
MRAQLLTFTAVLALTACNRSEPEAPADDTDVSNYVANSAEETSADSAKIDAAFVTEAVKGDNGEVAIGELAQAQGESQAVKDFGKLLVSDHGSHKQELVTLAQTAGVPVPDDPTEEAQANLGKLKALHGAAFDKEYKTMMIEDHTKDIAKYEKQVTSGDAQTAALAQKTLPTLRKHLDTANSL